MQRRREGAHALICSVVKKVLMRVGRLGWIRREKIWGSGKRRLVRSSCGSQIECEQYGLSDGPVDRMTEDGRRPKYCVDCLVAKATQVTGRVRTIYAPSTLHVKQLYVTMKKIRKRV